MKSLLQNHDFPPEEFSLPEGFKEQAIAGMTRAHRGTRRARRLRIVSALVMVALVAVFFSRRTVELPEISAVAAPGRSWVLQSKPFDGIVRTRPLPESIFIGKTELSATIVHTRGPRRYMEISDQDLLDLVGNRAVAIVKMNGAAEFTFLGP